MVKGELGHLWKGPQKIFLDIGIIICQFLVLGATTEYFVISLAHLLIIECVFVDVLQNFVNVEAPIIDPSKSLAFAGKLIFDFLNWLAVGRLAS